MSKLCFRVGQTRIRFTPSGMWGHKVWQNAKEYICSGAERLKDDGGYRYRFTAIGNNSIELPCEGFSDIFIQEKWLDNIRNDYQCDTSEINLPIGWVKFINLSNKRQLRESLALHNNNILEGEHHD